MSSELVLLELGRGSAIKTRYLINALFSRQNFLTYIPVEISQTIIESTAKQLLENYPNLKIEAYIGDYFDVLKTLNLDSSTRKLVLFLGSSIGNHSVEESTKLLKSIRAILSVGDALLLGADLKKPINVLEPAYDDSLGVTGAFNLNVLSHINRELGANFIIRSFKHVAFYNFDYGRVEMHLESQKEQSVFIKDLNLEVQFSEGETIHTENSYKYDIEALSDLARRTGFELENTWYDEQLYFSRNLFIACP